MANTTPLKPTLDQFGNEVSIARSTAAAVHVGGSSVLRGAAGPTTKALANSCGSTVAKQITRSGGKLAGRVAPILTVVEFGMDQAATEQDYRTGRLSRAEYETETAGNIGSAAGGGGGAYAGAILGSAICPGLGTVIGAVVGGFLGSSAGREAGRGIW